MSPESRHGFWSVVYLVLLLLCEASAIHFDIDAATGNITQFAISSFIENNGAIQLRLRMKTLAESS